MNCENHITPEERGSRYILDGKGGDFLNINPRAVIRIQRLGLVHQGVVGG
jgi:hypothetical protein